MAVAHDFASESHTGATGDTGANNSSFSWSHNPVGTPKGVFVVICNLVQTALDAIASVTYDGASLTHVTECDASDSAGETGSVQVWYLGSSVPTTDPATVQVTRSGVGGGYELWAVCCTVTASGTTEIYTTGVVKLQGDGTLAEQSVNDGSPGSDSVRYAGGHSGLGTPPGVGANSTALHDFDTGNQTAAVCRETTAGQGSRSVGFSSGTSDDRAFVHFAVREAGAQAFSLDAQPGSFSMTGLDATLARGLFLDAQPGSYSITGAVAGIARAFFIDAQPGSYGVTGVDAALIAARAVDAVPGSYAVTGFDAQLAAAKILGVDPGSYAVTGAQAALIADRAISALPGAYTITGAEAALLADRVIAALPGAYSLTGVDADLVLGTLVDFVLSADPGSYAVSGAAAGLLADRLISADPGSYAVTGFQAQTLADRVLVAALATYAVTGAAATLEFSGAPAVAAALRRMLMGMGR